MGRLPIGSKVNCSGRGASQLPVKFAPPAAEMHSCIKLVDSSGVVSNCLLQT